MKDTLSGVGRGAGFVSTVLSLTAVLALCAGAALAQTDAVAEPSEPVATSSGPNETPANASGATSPATTTEQIPALPSEPTGSSADAQNMARDAVEDASGFLKDGGPAIWAIAGLSVFTLALILWKIWRLALIGAWSRGKAGRAVTAFETGDAEGALALVKGRMGVRSKVVAAALQAISNHADAAAREETARVAKNEIASARTGLGALELIASIAPLLGLLGTVLGMIAAFQALQAAGSKADPALLAGGIWEALLTTAAGMAVAIPASAALTWFDSVIDRIRRDVEDHATRLFVAATRDGGTAQIARAAK